MGPFHHRAVAGCGLERRQAGPWSVGLTDGDRAVEPDDRVVRQARQFVVPLDDPHPVGLLGGGRVGVESREGGPRPGLAEPVPGEGGGPQGLDALGDRAGVPPAAALLGGRHQARRLRRNENETAGALPSGSDGRAPAPVTSRQLSGSIRMLR
ncbi:hypothetical protein [Streptomyces griseoloalbus]|uniref:hypothetical protein n=1 Tax=Streptomyces griseoloalbus TaxID=67303 RepID=UPI0018747E67